ncbi:MAG: hypothetical protein M1816_001166 [Peltula sp. TS41687]|nr:MAG: hypothetical protein M1816_001166 [Peltula sp. TS41687]
MFVALNISAWALALPVEDNEMQWSQQRSRLPPAPSNATPKERSNYLYQRCMEDFFLQREEERQAAINEGGEMDESLRRENDLQAAKDTGNEHRCFLDAWMTTEIQPDPYPGLDSIAGKGEKRRTWSTVDDTTHNESRLDSVLDGFTRQVGSVLNDVGQRISNVNSVPNTSGFLPSLPMPLMVPR